MSGKKNILLISHDATRTGAPILLLNLFKAIKDSYNIEFLLKGGGAIEDNFEQASNTFLAFSNTTPILIKKIKKKFLKSYLPYNVNSINWKQYDLVVSNTITNGDLLPLVKDYYKGPIVSYIHELEMATELFTKKEYLKQVTKVSDGYFVPSLAVKRHLIDNLKVDPSIISYVPYYTPECKIGNKHERKTNTFIIGSAGTCDWRKSPDLFLVIAKAFFTMISNADAKFIWKGAVSGLELNRLQYDIKKAGLDGKVKFIETSGNMDDFFSSIDLFLLTSREDPYPLVVLEAADLCIPTICFSESGGAQEFVINSDGGLIVPYLNIEFFAKKIVDYYNDREKLMTDGVKAKDYLKATHQNKEYVVDLFDCAVKRYLSN